MQDYPAIWYSCRNGVKDSEHEHYRDRSPHQLTLVQICYLDSRVRIHVAQKYEFDLQEIMATTTCNECGKMVSDIAQVCPNCGVPSPTLSASDRSDLSLIAKLRKSSMWGLVTIAFGVVSSFLPQTTWWIPLFMIAMGFIQYFVAMVKIILIKRKAKKIA